jgi:hypothetical protein
MTHPTITSDTRLDRAIDALRGARFHVRRKGVDMAEVDALLQRCLDQLEAARTAPAAVGDEGDAAWQAFWHEGQGAEPAGGRAVVALIEASKLRARRKGYDEDEVAALLAELTAILTGAPDAGIAEPAAVPTIPAAVAAPVATPGGAPAAPVVPTPTLPAPTAPRVPTEVPVSPEPVVPAPSPAEPVAVAPPVPFPPEVAVAVPARAAEDLLVREVLDASLRGARHAAEVAGVRHETERLALLRLQADLVEIDERTEQRRDELRRAAQEQCDDILVAARAEADRALAAVAARVGAQLEQLRADAAAELDRILAEEEVAAAEIAAAASHPDGAAASSRPHRALDRELRRELDELPRRPLATSPNGVAWNRTSVERHGPPAGSLSTHERVATDGVAPAS